jgi:hypothetical protein
VVGFSSTAILLRIVFVHQDPILLCYHDRSLFPIFGFHNIDDFADPGTGSSWVFPLNPFIVFSSLFRVGINSRIKRGYPYPSIHSILGKNIPSCNRRLKVSVKDCRFQFVIGRRNFNMRTNLFSGGKMTVACL